MLLKLLFLSCLFLSTQAAYCSGSKIAQCIGNFAYCGTLYQFHYNSTTMQPTFNPFQCQLAVGGGVCVTASSCTPPCAPKVGGPSGKACNDFTTQADCVKYYAEGDGGDRWCWWGPQTSGGNFCYEGLVCHN